MPTPDKIHQTVYIWLIANYKTNPKAKSIMDFLIERNWLTPKQHNACYQIAYQWKTSRNETELYLNDTEFRQWYEINMSTELPQFDGNLALATFKTIYLNE